jgi:cystathionine beta-lyase
MIRLNLATTPTIIQKALDRLIEAIKKEERHDH